MLESRVTFRLAKDLFDTVEQEARRRGLVTRSGRPNISSVLTHILREWLKGRPKDKP